MKEINKKNRKDRGYAILFTVVVVGIISVITIGLSNAAYKQMILSSVAKDSMTAFYQADIASECALYADNEEVLVETNVNPIFRCAEKYLNFKYTSLSPTEKNYQLNPSDAESVARPKCYRVDVTKTETADSITTKVEALGYNICNKSNLRTVERAIEVNY